MGQPLIPETAPALVHDPQSKILALHKLPIPKPNGPDEHLIEVKAVALTNGELGWSEPASQPRHIPGYEVSGVVRSAPAHSPFSPGTAVYACTEFERAGNARAYSVALTAELGRRPQNLSWEEAATVPLSALTAWQALFVHGGVAVPKEEEGGVEASASVNADKRVLVTAAAGGVGIFAVQLARLAGVGFVAGTCGPANAEFVRGLGAHAAVDYKATPDLAGWAAREGKFDLVIDGVGGDTLAHAWRCARKGGIVISIVAPAQTGRPAQGVEEGVRTTWFIVGANGEQLNRITRLIEMGKLKAVLDSTFPLEEYEAAFEKANGGHARGKAVLSVAS